MDDFLEKKPKKRSDAALATAARFSWATRASALGLCFLLPHTVGEEETQAQRARARRDKLAGTRMISQSLRRCFRNSLYKYVRRVVEGLKSQIHFCDMN